MSERPYADDNTSKMLYDQQPAQDAGRIIEVDTSKLTPIPGSNAAPTWQDAGQGTWRAIGRAVDNGHSPWKAGWCGWALTTPTAARDLTDYLNALTATVKRLEEENERRGRALAAIKAGTHPAAAQPMSRRGIYEAARTAITESGEEEA